MAKQVQAPAKGNTKASTAGPNKTPAPTKPAPALAPDVISTVRAEQNAGSHYGMNGFSGASSANPGEMVRSPLAENMKAAGERGSDPVLDAIVSQGTAAMSINPTGDAVRAAEGVTGSQIRNIGAKAPPDAYGMQSNRSRQPSYPGPKATIPGTPQYDDSAPARQPPKGK